MINSLSKRAYWVPAVVFILIAAVFLSLWWISHNHQRDLLLTRTSTAAEQVAPRLSEFVNVRFQLVSWMVEYWKIGRINTPESFKAQAMALHQHFSGLQAVNWVDPQGFIRWAVPEESNRAAIDKNLRQHPEAAATFLQAEQSGQMRVTPPLNLLQGGKGLAAYFPLIVNGENEGYLNAVFRIAPLIEACLGRGVTDHFNFTIFDEDLLVYASGNPREILTNRYHAANDLAIGNRTWRLTLAPRSEFPASSLSYINDLILALGLVLGLGLALLQWRVYQRERQLSDSEKRYRTIFKTTGNATVIIDERSNVQLVNDEFVNLTGYTREETIGKMTWMALFAPESLKKMLHYQEMRLSNPDAVPHSYETRLIDKRGQAHDGIITVNLLPGAPWRVASFLDLTERKQAEQQMLRADKMAALGQIIAGVAHEINNPNNFIVFNLPILKRYMEAIHPLLDRQAESQPALKILNMPYDAFWDDLYKLLANMEHGSQRITGIVAELKNYIRSHEAEDRRPADLRQIIQQVMILVGKQVGKMVKRFDVSIAESLPAVAVNAGKIEQVLINLIINAGQAADKEDSWVRVTAQASGEFVEIKVEDNGCGIPEETINRIFDPFFTTKSRDAGTGLGLSIAQRIIEEHGGKITVSSELGRGSCFTVQLPISRGEPT